MKMVVISREAVSARSVAPRMYKLQENAMACPHVVPNSARPHDLLAVPPRCAAGWRRLGYWLPPLTLLFLVRAEARVHGKNLHPGGKSYATDVLSSTRQFPLVASFQIRAQRSQGTYARQGGDYRPRAYQGKHDFPCRASRTRADEESVSRRTPARYRPFAV